MAARRQSRRSRRTWSRRIQLEPLESRRLLASDLPLGTTPLNTGDFLLGRVAVTPVLFESDGSIDTQSQNWTEEEIQETLAKVTAGVNWWSRTLDQMNTVHTVDFVIDDTFAIDPVKTGYEPIDHASSTFKEYVGAFLTAQGYGESSSLEHAVHRFNHDQRLSLETDWAFTIFIVDSSDDADGIFADGPFMGAFAFPGGLFMVVPSGRPASTYAHEMGHIFWARDEYQDASSYTDRRGYYNAQVLNAENNPDPDFVHEISIMRGGIPLSEAYQAETSPQSTLALVGWRDSDGDGIFDLADVPLALDAVGYFDAASSQYHIAGTASAVPLQNQNSAGIQSDMTLNRISALQYRLDDGPWTTADQPDQQTVDFDLTVPIVDDFETIHWRVIDQNIGVTSQVISAAKDQHALTPSAIQGFAYLDQNDNAQRDTNESLLFGAQIVVRNFDGSPLFGDQHAAADFAVGNITSPTAGVHLSARGLLIGQQVGSFDSVAAGGQRVFHSQVTATDTWIESWAEHNVFVAEFDQPVGEVEFAVIGLGDGSYTRLEAYDSSGNLIRRVTDDLLAAGESTTVTITDAGANIASVRAYGHAETSVAIEGIRFGYDGAFTTGPSGAWQIANLPDGDYQVELIADQLIHQFNEAVRLINVSGGTSETIAAGARRVTSARHNVQVPEDVNGKDGVTSLDALLIINDLNLRGARVLGVDEAEGDDIDVNDDGSVSALDALLVINSLNLQDIQGEQATSSEANRAAATDAVITGWTNAPVPITGVPTPGRQLLDSAGRDREDESAASLTTDTENEVVASGNDVIAASPIKTVRNGENSPQQIEKTSKNEKSSALKINVIAPEIPEPLAQKEV